MRFLLVLLLLAAAPLSAHESAPRQPFPDDYVPSPCAATAEAMCGGVEKVDFANLAFRFRGVTIDHAWIDDHWESMQEAFAPFCMKMTNCYTIRGNTTVWCQDQFRHEFISTCDRFPAGSRDREQCVMFATVAFITIPVKSELFRASQACAKQNGDWSSGTLEAWVSPSELSIDSTEPFTVYAIDAKRRIPVRATVRTDGGGSLDAVDSPYPMTSKPIAWQRKLRRVPNAAGRSDVVPPTLTIEADGYEPVKLTIPVKVPQLTLEMIPPPAELREGRQTVTIRAFDAATGQPVELRVMAGERILGRTNEPFELTIHGRPPEIWVTSLFDLYSDVVVVEGERF